MNEIKVYVEKCREGIELPKYARLGDAGIDICAAEDVEIRPNETIAIPTGLKMAIPVGYEVQVRPRSGLSLHTPLRVSNSPGTIDSGYRNEIAVIMTNTSPEIYIDMLNNLPFFNGVKSFPPIFNDCNIYSLSDKGNKNGIYKIKKGDRIAQLVLKEVPVMVFEEVDDVSTIGENRGGGLGHTGV